MTLPAAGRRRAVLVNLTPHTVAVMLRDGRIHRIAPSGRVARVRALRWEEGVIDVDGSPMPISRTALGILEGLPPTAPGTFFVVSRLVAEVELDRDDLLVPEDLVRDRDGRITACRSLGRVSAHPSVRDALTAGRDVEQMLRWDVERTGVGRRGLGSLLRRWIALADAISAALQGTLRSELPEMSDPSFDETMRSEALAPLRACFGEDRASHDPAVLSWLAAVDDHGSRISQLRSGRAVLVEVDLTAEFRPADEPTVPIAGRGNALVEATDVGASTRTSART